MFLYATPLLSQKLFESSATTHAASSGKKFFLYKCKFAKFLEHLIRLDIIKRVVNGNDNVAEIPEQITDNT